MSKFNFTQVGGARIYKPWKEWAVDDYIVGKLNEKYTDNYGNPGYAVEVLETSMNDVEVGKVLGLNSCGSLNFKMADVEVKDVIKLVYDGTEVMTKGKFKGKEFHTVSLFIDSANKEETVIPTDLDEVL